MPAAQTRSLLPQLQRLRHLVLADPRRAGEVGDGPRQPQRPVMRPPAEPSARVEVGEQRRRTRVELALAHLGGRHLGVAATGAEARFLALARRADPLAHRRRGLARGPPISSALGCDTAASRSMRSASAPLSLPW